MEFENQFFKRKVFLYIIFYNEKNLTTLFCSQINFFKTISKHISLQLDYLFIYELKTIVQYNNFCFKSLICHKESSQLFLFTKNYDSQLILF